MCALIINILNRSVANIEQSRDGRTASWDVSESASQDSAIHVLSLSIVSSLPKLLWHTAAVNFWLAVLGKIHTDNANICLGALFLAMAELNEAMHAYCMASRVIKYGSRARYSHSTGPSSTTDCNLSWHFTRLWLRFNL